MCVSGKGHYSTFDVDVEAKSVIYGEVANVMYGGLIRPQNKLKESRTGKQNFPLQPLSSLTYLSMYHTSSGSYFRAGIFRVATLNEVACRVTILHVTTLPSLTSTN